MLYLGNGQFENGRCIVKMQDMAVAPMFRVIQTLTLIALNFGIVRGAPVMRQVPRRTGFVVPLMLLPIGTLLEDHVLCPVQTDDVAIT
jgi:hypothetical protein